ncbi:hemin-degrading factor [Elioraea rosea]|uniref:hemin-degrading factor n=1 Tax=Elioraea rosea TaxID=2492390 RepID=UPI00194ED260|nr:ChuX/HutX family heme-like substrate-binding protein [Elioraea rosea]
MMPALDGGAAIAERFAALRAERPGLRVRDAAARLGVPEAALVASTEGAVRLRHDWAGLLAAISRTGDVMALTRNETVVHERHGTYGTAEVHGKVGLIVGDEIDLRLFLAYWAHAWFVPAGRPGSPRGSVQVFDAAGIATHKIFATEATDAEVFAAIAHELADDDQAVPAFIAAQQPRAPRADAAVDGAGLREAWATLPDTHDFIRLLRRFDVTRHQAMRLAGEDFAAPIGTRAPVRALETAAGSSLPVMVFVNNPGTIQIHSGPVRRVEMRGPWFNVLDPRFNLHLRTDGLASAWLVRKPTVDGIVTSIEAFDRDDQLVLMLFGKRKPGQAEDEAWRALATAVTLAEPTPC